jgi:hypothetical protein
LGRPRRGNSKVATFRTSARDPKLSHVEALRHSMLAMIDAAKSDGEASPLLAVEELEKPQ